MAAEKTGKGFEIAYNIRTKLLSICVWGRWDAEFGRKYNFALRDKMLELSAQARWPVWYALLDMRGFAAQSDDVEEVIAAQLNGTAMPDLKRMACVHHDGAGRRMREACDRAEAFRSVDEALQWLLAPEETI
jgi:hypothetical protein